MMPSSPKTKLRSARTFEPVSQSGAESADILLLLMSLDHPTLEVVRAVEAGARWFEAVKLTGIRETTVGGDKQIVRDAAAPPLWARFYEIPSMRPIFSGRDSVIKYDIAQIEPERRNGYAWYGQWGAKVAAGYRKWAKRAPPWAHRKTTADENQRPDKRLGRSADRAASYTNCRRELRLPIPVLALCRAVDENASDTAAVIARFGFLNGGLIVDPREPIFEFRLLVVTRVSQKSKMSDVVFLISPSVMLGWSKLAARRGERVPRANRRRSLCPKTILPEPALRCWAGCVPTPRTRLPGMILSHDINQKSSRGVAAGGFRSRMPTT